MEVARVVALDAPEQLGDRLPVARLRGADPVVVAHLEPAPEFREPVGHQIHPLLRRVAVLLGRLHNRLGVLVHPHQEMDLVSPEPPVAGDAVRPDLFQRMSQMGIAVGVVDGRGEVEFGHAER